MSTPTYPTTPAPLTNQQKIDASLKDGQASAHKATQQYQPKK